MILTNRIYKFIGIFSILIIVGACKPVIEALPTDPQEVVKNNSNTPPNLPLSLNCPTTPFAGSPNIACTLIPNVTPDLDGDSTSYYDGGSTCASTSVSVVTGEVTFTAPAKGLTCVVKVKAYDGALYSSAVSSSTITGANNAPNTPNALACASSPPASSLSNTCTLTPNESPDSDGDTVSYVDDGSTCSTVVVNSFTGNATFTAPAKGATCLVKIKAYDNSLYSGSVSSAIITGANRAPNNPISLTCTTSPAAGSANNICTLTPNATPDPDGDTVTYVNDTSTCNAASVSSDGATITFTAPPATATCVMKVKAYDNALYSSTVTSATITGTILPPGPFSIPSATGGDTQAVLTWEDSLGATNYTVKYGFTSGSYPTTFSTTATSPTTVTGLTNGETYYFMVTAVNSGGNTNATVEKSATPEAVGVCPTNYILVPANAAGGTNNDFCVMRFEAKNVAGVATSQAANTPWVNINQTSAKTACTNLGAKFDLISNPEWLTIAQNAENVVSNWSGGDVGIGMMTRGHSDGNPDSAIAITNTTDPYNGTGNNSGQAAGSGREQKRTLTLSNGNIIWDFAGNVWEWIDWSMAAGLQAPPTTCISGWTELPLVSCGALAGAEYLPSHSDYNSSQGMGQFYGGAGGAALRSGFWNFGSRDGAFTLFLYNAPTAANSGISFRCVYRP